MGFRILQYPLTTVPDGRSKRMIKFKMKWKLDACRAPKYLACNICRGIFHCGRKHSVRQDVRHVELQGESAASEEYNKGIRLGRLM